MSIRREDFIHQIASKIISEELSVFLGAGISTAVGIPCWKDLLAPLALKLHLDIEKQSNYYLLAQYYINMYGKPELKKHINTHTFSFRTDNIALEKLLKFNLKTIWTTNFDNSIEKILDKHLIRYQVVNSDRGLSNVSYTDATTIYKLNGDRNDLDNIVIAMEDWESYEETHPAMITFLKKELVSNTFLFFGYSFQDNLVKSMLSHIKRFVGDSCNMHYLIQEKKDEKEFEYQINDLELRYHVKTLVVNNYNEVPQIFDEIMNTVCSHNIFISGRLGDVAENIELEACELARKISIDLLKSDYNICTGMGRKIGYFVAGPAIQYLLEQGYPHIERRLKVRPFDDTMSVEQRSAYRKKLLENNHAVIIMYGQSSYKNRSPGVWEEYQLSLTQNKIIIPLGSTGYESHEIWRDVKSNLTKFPYLETAIDALEKETRPEKLSKLILNILSLVVE